MRKAILSEGKTKGAGTNEAPKKPKPNIPPPPRAPQNISLTEDEKLEHKVNGNLTASLSFAEWNTLVKHLEDGLQIVPTNNRSHIIEAMEELQSQLSNTVFYYTNSPKHRKLFPDQFIEKEQKVETNNLDKDKSVKLSWWKKLFKKERK